MSPRRGDRGHNQRAWKKEEGKPGRWEEGGCTLRAPGTITEKAVSLLLIWGGCGSDFPSVDTSRRSAFLTLNPQPSTPGGT